MKLICSWALVCLVGVRSCSALRQPLPDISFWSELSGDNLRMLHNTTTLHLLRSMETSVRRFNH